jgi:hypothetical protein
VEVEYEGRFRERNGAGAGVEEEGTLLIESTGEIAVCRLTTRVRNRLLKGTCVSDSAWPSVRLSLSLSLSLSRSLSLGLSLSLSNSLSLFLSKTPSVCPSVCPRLSPCPCLPLSVPTSFSSSFSPPAFLSPINVSVEVLPHPSRAEDEVGDEVEKEVEIEAGVPVEEGADGELATVCGGFRSG